MWQVKNNAILTKLKNLVSFTVKSLLYNQILDFWFYKYYYCLWKGGLNHEWVL